MNTEHTVKLLLGQVLGLSEQSRHWDATTSLLGGMPEFDSMAVVALLTSLEEHLGIEFDDDIHADDFATVGSLVSLVQRAQVTD